MNTYCTLFDSHYLARALVMHESLLANDPDCVLYAFTFDETAEEVLRRLDISNIRIVPLSSFETAELLAVKPSRTAGEYCWTCTPQIIKHTFVISGADRVTYVDADLRFFSPPRALFNELDAANGSVLITPHRYSPEYDYSNTAGIYCVQFMAFSKNNLGQAALNWWAEKCLEWCFARMEDGKFGDQKYLDDWPARFAGVHVLDHIGGGVAPWNVQRYRITDSPRGLLIDGTPLVFYHFQNYKYYRDGVHDFVGRCRLTPQSVELLYFPYARALLAAHARISRVMPDFQRGFSVRPKGLVANVQKLRRVITGVNNEFRIVFQR